MADAEVAVFFADVLDDLGPACLAEVDVDIRRRNTLGIEESLKHELEAQRIDVRDAEAEGDQRACG